MSEDNEEEHKRSPFVPHVFVREHGRLRPKPRSGTVRVAFEMWEQHCRYCHDLEKTFDMPHDKYMDQLTKLGHEREPVKIKCGAVNRCRLLLKLVNEWKEKHGYV